MATETAFAFLKSAGPGLKLAPVAVIFGPHPFLREYVLSVIVRGCVAAGFQHRSIQVGAGDDFAGAIDQLGGAELFAPRRIIVCRVLKSRRDRGDANDSAAGDRASASAGEGALAAAIEQYGGPCHFVLLYERDNAPAKIRRAAEKAALQINCPRPFDNEIDSYAELFARRAGLKLTSAALDLLAARHGGDLGAIANAVEKAAIFADRTKPIGPDQIDEPGAKRMPGVFEIADSIARGDAPEALARIDLAIMLGRDPIEILAVEIVPALRRMMIAASMAARRRGPREISAAMGLAPASRLVTRAIDGARRFGLGRVEAAWRRACELDAGFKNGAVKERGQALAALLIDLMSPAPAAASAPR
jgi:DNA polymerase III delta subunit